MKQRVFELYAWMEGNSKVLRRRKRVMKPQLRLRCRAVMGAFHWTMGVYKEIDGELPVTMLPWRHILTLADMVASRRAYFLQNGVQASPGETHYVYSMCHFDTALRVRSASGSVTA